MHTGVAGESQTPCERILACHADGFVKSPKFTPPPLMMGLKFLRTSVDHGTAFDIAGKGIADARGMMNAIMAAAQYAFSVKARS